MTERLLQDFFPKLYGTNILTYGQMFMYAYFQTRVHFTQLFLSSLVICSYCVIIIFENHNSG